jgi:hypothetical protein
VSMTGVAGMSTVCVAVGHQFTDGSVGIRATSA